MDAYQLTNEYFGSDVKRINDMLGVTSDTSSDFEEGIAGTLNVDLVNDCTHEVTVPYHLSKTLRAGLTSRDSDVNDDLLCATMLMDSEFGGSVSTLIRQIRDIYDSRSTGAPDIVQRAISVASSKELQKMQVLVGAPICHTPLGIGTHFVHAGIPEGFASTDWS